MERVKTGLTPLDRAFPGLVLLAIALGLAMGKWVPQVGRVLEPFIPWGLFLMIYPTAAKVPFRALGRSALETRPLLVAILFNYLINPLLLFAFGWLFLRQYPELFAGLVLLGIAPCIGMVLVWADLAGAHRPLAVGLMVWNSILQIATVPLWLYALLGAKASLPLGAVFGSAFLYLGLPLLMAYVTQRLAFGWKGEGWFWERLAPRLGKVQLTALLATLVAMFALKGEAILEAPWLIGHMLLPLVLFFGLLFALSASFACLLLGLPLDKSLAVAFNVTGRNFELSIALALSAFAASPLVAVSTAVGPLIEVPFMLLLVEVGRRLMQSYPLCCQASSSGCSSA
ncbi:arsenic resistance protein [Thermus albus]|uniref:arsenic resistance protein n=1 Tax=Thermus albus TaxID=2908146 RepID=UPI001FAB351F|nr:hypothetical protein [Thermus albus]